MSSRQSRGEKKRKGSGRYNLLLICTTPSSQTASTKEKERMATKATRQPPPRFADSNYVSVDVESTWKLPDNVQTKEMECQTDLALYELEDMDTQAGLHADIYQEFVTEETDGMTILQRLTSKFTEKTSSDWLNTIESGFVSIDNEPMTNPGHILRQEELIEYVNYISHVSTQTEPPHATDAVVHAIHGIAGVEEVDFIVNNAQIGEKKDDGDNRDGREDKKRGGDDYEDDYEDEYYDDDDLADSEEKASKNEGKSNEGKSNEGKQSDSKSIGNSGVPGVNYPHLEKFLSGVMSQMEDTLKENSQSSAFDGYELIEETGSEDVAYWKALSVDLEKKKVTFPDWMNAKHYRARIVSCSQTRNMERVYEVDFDDGGVLSQVREEHIRMLPAKDGGDGRSVEKKKQMASMKLPEGIQLHVRVEGKRGNVRYLPGRIVRSHKGGLYDVEIEGNKQKQDVTSDDLVIGLEPGQRVECRYPSKVHLGCTGLSWTTTGSALAAAYGRHDITGWCDYPGAVCVWNIFSRTFDPANPDFVLDHPCCIMSVRCHPENPSLVAAGSFNGEVLVWDLTNTDGGPIAISNINEYSHKEPVRDLCWVFDSSLAEYVLISAGSDGRALCWSLRNNFSYPIRGHITATKRASVSKRVYVSSPGITTLAIPPVSSGMGGRTTRVMAGLEGGGIIRSAHGKLLSGSTFSKETFKNYVNPEELYLPIRADFDRFEHDKHIGTVNALEVSPFDKNLLLSAGQDGCIKLFHMQDTSPIREWEPSPPANIKGPFETISSLTAASFSPIRPLVFAAASIDGLVYIFDLNVSSSAPVSVLELPIGPDNRHSNRRASIMGLAFNKKQRDLIAACDNDGRIHIWRLSWNLSNRQVSEESFLKVMVDEANRSSNSNDPEVALE